MFYFFDFLCKSAATLQTCVISDQHFFICPRSGSRTICQMEQTSEQPWLPGRIVASSPRIKRYCDMRRTWPVCVSENKIVLLQWENFQKNTSYSITVLKFLTDWSSTTHFSLILLNLLNFANNYVIYRNICLNPSHAKFNGNNEFSILLWI